MSDFQNNNWNNDENNQVTDKKSTNNSGLKIFLLLVCVVCMFTAFVFLGYAMFIDDDDNTSATVSNTSVVVDEEDSSQEDVDSQESTDSEDITENDSDNDALEEDTTTTNTTTTTTSGLLEMLSSDGLEVLSNEEIAQKVMPSIVGIVAYDYDDDGEILSYGSGSGIIMTSDGLIITNAHVISDEENFTVDEIEIYLDNGETYIATILGSDTKTDLAVLKIEAENLVAAEFGDSNELSVGETAIAIGNPTGLTLAGSFTLGVISGVDRTMEVGDAGYTIDYIQTDAAINPGNSGGALVNQYGQVIGINTSKISSTEYEGIGFAIPVDEAQSIVNSIIESGYVTGRARVGVTFTSITAEMAEVYGVPSGMRVVTVEKNADVYAKGVQMGDIIVQINGIDVVELADVSVIIQNMSPGEEITLTIYRDTDGEPKTFDVDIALAEYTE